MQTYGGSVTDELCQRPESLLPVSPRRFGYPGRKRVDDRAALPCRNVPGGKPVFGRDQLETRLSAVSSPSVSSSDTDSSRSRLKRRSTTLRPR